MTVLIMLAMLAGCSGGGEAAAPDPAPTEAPTPDDAPTAEDELPNPLDGRQPVSLKPLPEGVAIVLVGHQEHEGATLLIDGEEVGKVPTKAKGSTGAHKVELKLEDGRTIVWDGIPFVQRHAAITPIDLTDVPHSRILEPADAPE